MLGRLAQTSLGAAPQQDGHCGISIARSASPTPLHPTANQGGCVEARFRVTIEMSSLSARGVPSRASDATLSLVSTGCPST